MALIRRRTDKMNSIQWGTVFPNSTLLVVIGLAYSIISPMVNAFIAVGFLLMWFVYKYLFLCAYARPALPRQRLNECRRLRHACLGRDRWSLLPDGHPGLPLLDSSASPCLRLAQHIFVGLYIEELCLTGLFFLGNSAIQRRSRRF
jgi:hypothetical protein